MIFIKKFNIKRFMIFIKRLKMKLAMMYYLPENEYEKPDYRKPVLMRAKQCGNNLKVWDKTIINNNTWLGNNVNINSMTIAGRGKVVIGDNFHSGPECLMIVQIHNYDKGNAVPYDGTYIPKDILIEDNVWLGSRVIVLGGSTIGEGAIIQAGSCVVSDIPKYAIAGGHPAQVLNIVISSIIKI